MISDNEQGVLVSAFFNPVPSRYLASDGSIKELHACVLLGGDVFNGTPRAKISGPGSELAEISRGDGFITTPEVALCLNDHSQADEDNGVESNAHRYRDKIIEAWRFSPESIAWGERYAELLEDGMDPTAAKALLNKV